MYDYAHPLSDALEKITHSLCTLEFQDHRPLYDWFIDNLPVPAKPIQTEFARLNLSHTVTSKRKLRQLVEEKIVEAGMIHAYRPCVACANVVIRLQPSGSFAKSSVFPAVIR